MTNSLARDEVFWKLIAALDSANMLAHVMIIGSWAEWLYSDYFANITKNESYHVDIGKTHDIDVYFRDYLMEIDGAEQLKSNLYDAGFVAGSDFKGTFFFQGVEVEFLAGTVDVGEGIIEIPSVGIKAERLNELSMLEPTWVEKRGYRICVPTPASYVAQKLYINPERQPKHKRAQDIRKVDVLLRAMANVPGQLDDLESLINRLPSEKAIRVREVAAANGLLLGAG